MPHNSHSKVKIYLLFFFKNDFLLLQTMTLQRPNDFLLLQTMTLQRPKTNKTTHTNTYANTEKKKHNMSFMLEIHNK